MKLTERLRYLAAKQDCPGHVEALLEEAAQKLEDQRHWRDAWLRTERRVELLTSELSMLKSNRLNRKQKESDD